MHEFEFFLDQLTRGDTILVRLPKGRILELEWLEGEVNAIRTVGFANFRQYLADEEYRLAGHQPQLRCFAGRIPMQD